MQCYQASQRKMTGNIITKKFPKFSLSTILAKGHEIIFMFVLFGNLYLYPQLYIISPPRKN